MYEGVACGVHSKTMMPDDAARQHCTEVPVVASSRLGSLICVHPSDIRAEMHDRLRRTAVPCRKQVLLDDSSSGNDNTAAAGRLPHTASTTS